MLEFVITGAGFTLAGAVLAYSAGWSKGVAFGQQTMRDAIQQFARDNAAKIKAGELIIDLLDRHTKARGFTGSGIQIITSIDSQHEGRAYRFTLTESEDA